MEIPEKQRRVGAPVQPSSIRADVRVACRKKALRWHPDKLRLWRDSLVTAEEAKERFQQIQEAYEVLSDASTGAMYDADVFQFDQLRALKMMPSIRTISLGEMVGMMDQTKQEHVPTMDELAAMMDEMMKGLMKGDDLPRTPGRGKPQKHNSSSSSRSVLFLKFTVVPPDAGVSGTRGKQGAASSSSTRCHRAARKD